MWIAALRFLVLFAPVMQFYQVLTLIFFQGTDDE